MMTEHENQVALFQWAQWHEGQYPELAMLYAIPNGGHRHKATAARMKAEGVKAGVWDVHLPVARRGYVGVWIEMKYGRNSLTPAQSEWQGLMWDAGHFCQVCYDWQEAADTLEWYLSQ